MYCMQSISAEDEGFKPPIPVNGYTGFRVQRIRSLCQSSLFPDFAREVTLFSANIKTFLEIFLYLVLFPFTKRRKFPV